MPTSVTFDLFQIHRGTPDSDLNEFAYFQDAGVAYRSLYKDEVYVQEAGPVAGLAIPAGFDLSDNDQTATVIIEDPQAKVGPGALLLHNPSPGGGSSFTVLDFQASVTEEDPPVYTGAVFTYTPAAGRLLSAATYGGGFIFWVEVETTPIFDGTVSEYYFNVHFRKANCDFTSPTTFKTYRAYDEISMTVNRPISPRLSSSGIFILLSYTAGTPKLQDLFCSLFGNTALHGASSQASYSRRDAVGYPKSTGGSFYAHHGGTGAIADTYQMVWRQDGSIDAPLGMWPEIDDNADWGAGTFVWPRFGHLASSADLFQIHYTNGQVVRGKASGEADPSPLPPAISFLPEDHPDLLIAPSIMVFIGDRPDLIALPPTEASEFSVETITVTQ